MNSWGSACPAPDPPMTIVAPSRTWPTASRTSTILVTPGPRLSWHVPPGVGVERLAEEQARRIGEQEDDRLGHLVRAPEAAERHVPEPSLALRAVHEVGRHLGDRHARRDRVHTDPDGPELTGEGASQADEPGLGRAVRRGLRHAHLAEPRG